MFGGIEQMLLTIAASAAVVQEQMTSAFAIASPGRLVDELRAANADVVLLGDVRMSRPGSIVHARSMLARAIDVSRPSLVIFHAPWSLVLFSTVARRKGVPLVLWQHDHASGGPLLEKCARRMRADLVVCNSRWTARSAGVLQPSVPVAIVHPPVTLPSVDDSARVELRRSLGADEGSTVILSVSRMEKWKGHANVLQALALMRDEPSWIYWIAGGAQRPHEREYVASLQKLAEQLGIAFRTRFLGERRDVPALMRASDIFCQMNEGPEPFGIVLAEALLSGRPVVTADLGGAPEIVSADCGRLVPAGDLRALAGALSELLADSSLRERLGSAGRAHATERCSPAVVLPQLAQALRSLKTRAAA